MHPDDYVHLDNLRQKMKPLMEVKKELENWRPEKEKDDNVFRIHIKNIERKASSIQEKCTKARSELSQACSNNFLGDKFSTSIEKFCEASQLNTVLNNKMSEAMNEVTKRGLSEHQANMRPEDIKSIIPVFDGESSLSVLDAFDIYKTKLSKSGISRSMWGSIVLSKISGEARSRIPAHIQRQPDMDTIENQLTDYYGDSLAVSKLIMLAHEKAGEIPDPHTKSGIQGTLRVLQLHSEILEHADRFLKLTKEATAVSNLVSGANIQILLNLLPQRIRLDLSGLSKAVLDERARRNLYKISRNGYGATSKTYSCRA